MLTHFIVMRCKREKLQLAGLCFHCLKYYFYIKSYFICFLDVEYEDSPKTADNKENEPQVTAVKNEVISALTDEIKPMLCEIKEEVLSPKEDKPIREIKKGIRRLTADRQLIAASGLPFSNKDITENAW